MTQAHTMPDFWLMKEYEPDKHLMQLKGRDYMNVANRTVWFIGDQRRLTDMGLARTSYLIHVEAVEISQTFACFKATVRDVLGNESTDYGSETAKDFGDHIEKASTKAQGRALLGLGYGTAFSPENDEGERVADAPRERTTKPTTDEEPYETTFPKYGDDELKAKSRALAAELGIVGNDAYADAFYAAIGGVKSPSRVTRQDRDTWYAHLIRLKSDRIAAQEERELAGLKKMRAKIAPNSPEVVNFTPEPGEPDAPLSFPAPDAPIDHDLRTLPTGTRGN